MDLNFSRKPKFSDVFYPADVSELKQTIAGFLNKADINKSEIKPHALIVPHAGYIYSVETAAYAYKFIKYHLYKKVILIGPSHNFAFQGMALYPKGFWFTPLGKIPVLSKDDFPTLKNSDDFIESWEIHEPEHSIEVQLPFLQSVIKGFSILPMIIGEINIASIVESLSKILDGQTLIIISSDLSHYHTYSEAQKLDTNTIDAILNNDIEEFIETGEACGQIGIEIIMRLAKMNNWQAKLLDYRNSGDTKGDKDKVVGYSSIAFL